MRILFLFVFAIQIFGAATAQAQGRACGGDNFSQRRALVHNAAPMIEISSYRFCNSQGEGLKGQFIDSLSWKNTGNQPIVAFELLLLRFDPFDRPMKHRILTLPGRAAGGWQILDPGQQVQDSFADSGSQTVMTGIAVVRSVRLANGEVWQADAQVLQAALQTLAPQIKEWGKW